MSAVRKYQTYEAMPLPVPAKKKKIVRKPNQRKLQILRRQRLFKIGVVAFCFFMAFIVVSGHASIAQTNRKIAAVNKQVSDIRKENQQTQAQLEYNLDLKNIEEYAKNQLGMNRPLNYQIVRLNMNKQDRAEVIQTRETSFFSAIGQFFSSAIAYLQ